MTEDKFDFAFVRIKFKEIRPDNLNPRHHRDPEADLTLRRLIDTHGTIDIMWICKGENDHFRLLDGHRRYDILVEDEYLEQNPTITCALLLAKDNPDRLLTEEEITLWRILRERGKEKWKDFDFYLKAVEHADSQKEKGRRYFQIAREDFDWSPDYLSKVKSVLDDPILADFLGRATVSMRDATRLLNLPAETQKDLIEARDTMSAYELRETVKLVREGMETASAVESVKEAKKDISEPSEDDALSVLINRVPEDLRERFIKDTKDMNLHDIERIVKLIETGVVMHDAIRTVKLKTEIPQGTEEDALTVHDGEGETTETKDDDSGRKSLQPPSPETSIIDRGFEIGGEKGAEVDSSSEKSLHLPESPLPEEGLDVGETGETVSTPPVVEDVDPSPETKSTESKPRKFVNRMLNLGVAVDSHMKEKELEGLDDCNYRKILKDYEEASFAIETFRDFLQGRENNGSVQFNRAKRLHNAIRDFDAHSISSIKEATDLRSIKIQTKKKLTEDVNIFDNIINAKK